MDEASFRSVKSGEVVWSDNGQYCYFRPNPLPFELTIGPNIQRLLDQTLISLGRLDGKVSQMTAPERDIILTAFALKESTLSSAIEGTGTTMGDMYRSSKQPERDRRRAEDNKEVANYRDALKEGPKAIIDEAHLSEELLFKLHGILLDGTRGSNCNPGSFRDCQVFVGNAGDDLETARYVPVPPDAVPWLMDQWFGYINSDEYENPLIKVALAHYQFETIHPFKDGNGRMGRLTIMLMLRLNDTLVHPVLYPSEFFNRYRSEYIERLSAVREKDEIEEWIAFFLKGLSTQADKSIQMIDKLDAYRKETLNGAGANQAKAIEMLFINPYLRIKDVKNALGITATSAAKIVNALESKGILRETTGQRRNKLYVADRILEILESRRCFEESLSDPEASIPDHAVRQYPHAGDPHDHRVPGPDLRYSLGRPRDEDVPRLHRHVPGHVRDQKRQGEDHVRRVPELPDLPIDGQLQIEILRIVHRTDRHGFGHRPERVHTLAEVPCVPRSAGFGLHVPGGDVVEYR